MTTAIKDTVIHWDDNSPRVAVTTQAHGIDEFEAANGGTFDNSSGNCTSTWVDATDAWRLDHMVEMYCTMVDIDGVEEQAILPAFSKVIEWRTAYSDKRMLERAVRMKRVEMERRLERKLN